VKEAMADKQSSSRISACFERDVQQQTISQSFERVQKYERKGKRWRELTDSVTYFLAKGMLPLNTVEKPGFKKMISSFDNRYEVPSRTYFSRTAIPALYDVVRSNVQLEITKVHYYSSTTDLWSSVGLCPYISFTIHYIDDQWNLRSRCLQTQFLPQDHTGENLADAFTSTLEAWTLDVAKQVCLTTDSASNMINAAQRLNWIRLSCFGHNLHLAITKAIKDDTRCTRAIDLCKKIVSAFSTSWKRKRELHKCQVDLGLKQQSLVADCPTRWGTTGKMLCRILEQEEAIRRALSMDRKVTHLLPKWQDMDVIKAIHDALSPLSTLTDLLSGENYVTVSVICPMLRLIESRILKEKDTDTQLTKDIKDKICSDLTSRYESYDSSVLHLLNMASVLDPRFKMNYIDSSIIDDLRTSLLSEGEEITIVGCTGALDTELTMGNNTDVTEPPPSKKRNIGSLFKDGEEEQLPILSPSQRIKAELDTYLSSRNLDMEGEPLLWWKQHNVEYPILSKLAQKYLCVCATSTSSERLFSTSGSIVTPQRAGLKPEKVNMLTFLAKNL
jgi:hypothetical protein